MRRLITADAVVTAEGVVGDSILLDGDRIFAVGSHVDLAGHGLAEDRFPGATLLPGLRDAHIHAVPYAALLDGCSLKAAKDIPDLQARLSAYARRRAGDSPIVATRFDDESLAERRLPTREDLDAAVSDRPVVIYRYCGHVAVANTVALHMSGVTATTSDPEGGTIDRNPDGQPTGVLRETAVGLISGSLARGGRVEADQLVQALHRLAGLGVTSIGAMMGYGESPSEKLEAEVELWREVAPRLPINVHGFTIAQTREQLESSARTLSGAGSRLTWLGVKRFSDGSLGGHTAAMCRPFADVDSTGTYRLTPADTEVARHSLRLGGMVAIHAIGDRAVGGVLDVFETLLLEGADPADLRMEHVSVITPDQIERFSRMGVTASVQPAFLASESEWLETRVGSDRLPWVYPFRSMLAAGIPLAGSSDCPVEPPHPLWGMAAAMDRYGIGTNECFSGLEALGMFTKGAARALREPQPLSQGSPADFVIIDTDPSTAAAAEIHDATVIETYVGGVPVEVDRALPTWMD